MQTETLELSVQETLPMFKTNRQQRQQFVMSVMEQIEEGNLNPLQVHLSFKAMADVSSLLTDRSEKTNKDFCHLAKKYNSLLLDAAQQYGNKSFEFEKGKFEIKETGTTYDYSKCNDPKLVELKAAADKAKKELEERQKFLQVLPAKGCTLTDEETGETTTIYPPAKSSTTSVSVSLK